MLRLLALLTLLLAPLSAFAGDEIKPDDVISIHLSTEGWVTTKTARVTVMVNAAVAGDKSGAMRDDMLKSVQALSAKGDWRLTSFNRNQDETGLERWYATYEARLEEVELGGLAAKAKSSGKVGMQLQVTSIDFTPTLAEVEAVRAELRKTLLAMASKELESINAALPGRTFRLAQISFEGARPPMPPQVMMMRAGKMAEMAMADAQMAPAPSVETAQRMQMTAEVSFSALPQGCASPAK